MSTTFTLRNLEEPVMQKLRMLAASHQRSVEDQAREILTLAVTPAQPVKTAVLLTPQAAKSACDSFRGSWKHHNTSTDELMQILRGED